MKNFIFISGVLFLMSGCEKMDRPNQPTPPTAYSPDNTGVNVRDRDGSSVTSGDQSESEEDRNITARIRNTIVKDSSISTNGKNIKIITINRRVTLRGPVLDEAERDRIVKKAQSVAGVSNVDNQLEPSK